MRGGVPAASDEAGLDAAQVMEFQERLMVWYGRHARVLPWRGIRDPYRTWVSEVMLQQTRVAAVLEHYDRFLREFPTVEALAAAPEEAVLAAWSGLGYYRRARMMHRAAQFVVRELGGRIPEDSAELRRLPGVGEYTAAAVASIGFGESVAVLDGNVERVLLRVVGRAEDPTAAGSAYLRGLAGRLVPERGFDAERNAAGDHNQAMMELGATVCVPRGPLCLQCPVYALCRTRGEHAVATRERAQVRHAAYVLALRESDAEVLLERRDSGASLMPGMLELPPVPLDAVEGWEPVLRVRHAITNTNWAVAVYREDEAGTLMRAVPASAESLGWFAVSALPGLPMTGLARKVLRRLGFWPGA